MHTYKLKHTEFSFRIIISRKKSSHADCTLSVKPDKNRVNEPQSRHNLGTTPQPATHRVPDSWRRGWPSLQSRLMEGCMRPPHPQGGGTEWRPGAAPTGPGGGQGRGSERCSIAQCSRKRCD